MYVKAKLYVEYVDVLDSDGEIKTKHSERAIYPFFIGSLSPRLQQEFWDDWVESIGLSEHMVLISVYGSVVEVVDKSKQTDQEENIFSDTESVSFIQPFNFLKRYLNE